MKAWVCRKSGKPTSNPAFTLETDFPTPVPKAKQILVKVKTVGINPGGANAMFAPPFVWLQKRPAVPELEFSGEITGGDLTGTDFAIGDECFGITVFPFVHMPPNPPSPPDSFSASESLKTGHGALGEYTITDSTRLLRKPATLSHIDAAALPVATILPYWSMVNFGGLKLGGNQRVFVNGGSGATGTGAIQIAKAFGAHVVSTCSPTSEALVRSLGADEVVDYRSVALTTYLADNYSGDKSFDVIMDCIGVDAIFRASPAYLKPGGAYATIGAPTHEGIGSVMKFGMEMMRNMLLPGFLGGTPRKYEFIQVPAKLWESTFRNCLELIEQGKVKAIIDSTCTMEDALKGYERVLSGRTKGKVVITLDGAV